MKFWERIFVVLGVCLPVPVFAATGLSFPLPSTVERLAAGLVPFAEAATLREHQAVARGERGAIVLTRSEDSRARLIAASVPVASTDRQTSGGAKAQRRRKPPALRRGRPPERRLSTPATGGNPPGEAIAVGQPEPVPAHEHPQPADPVQAADGADQKPEPKPEPSPEPRPEPKPEPKPRPAPPEPGTPPVLPTPPKPVPPKPELPATPPGPPSNPGDVVNEAIGKGTGQADKRVPELRA